MINLCPNWQSQIWREGHYQETRRMEEIFINEVQQSQTEKSCSSQTVERNHLTPRKGCSPSASSVCAGLEHPWVAQLDPPPGNYIQCPHSPSGNEQPTVWTARTEWAAWTVWTTWTVWTARKARTAHTHTLRITRWGTVHITITGQRLFLDAPLWPTYCLILQVGPQLLPVRASPPIEVADWPQ